jgi:uncharacterized protein involved in exopolysaccharide biosynthesis
MSEAAEAAGDPPPLFDIAGLLGTLWQRKLAIAATALAVVLLALAYIAVTKPTYTAVATILLDPRDSRATGLDTVLPGLGADSAAISSQVAVIESIDLLGAVFDEMHLGDDPEFGGGPASKLSREAIFERFRGRVSVDREGLTYVIDVSFKSSDREKAARIANAIVDSYRASLAGQKENANSEANTLLNARIGDLEKAVSDTEREVQDFKFRNHIFDAGAGGTLQSQIDQFAQQLVAAQNASSRAQTQYDQAVAAGTGPDGLARLSEILNSNTADRLRDDYNQRAAALANSEVVLGPRHPTITAMSAELARIRGLMATEAARITAELKAQRDLAVKNVAQIQARLAQLRDEANKSDLAQVQLRQLQRKADAARSVLDDFLKRSQETQHLEGMQISQVRVISAAVAPVAPTWPRPKLILAVSALLGLMLGGALALMMGARDEAHAGLLEKFRRSGKRLPGKQRPKDRPVKEQPAVAASAPVGAVANPGRELPVLGTVEFPFAEGGLAGGIRALRTEMQRFRNTALLRSVEQLLVAITDRLRPGTTPPFVLLVSSLRNGGERHMAAAAIGIGLDHIHQNVLVVDLVAAAMQPPSPAMTALRAAPFVDTASGLRTMIVDAGASAARTSGEFARLVDHWVAMSGAQADFVVVIDRPFGDPGRSAGLAAGADLSVFALSPADLGSGGGDWLRDRLAPAERGRGATMVVAVATDRPAAADTRQAPVAANTERPLGSILARG